MEIRSIGIIGAGQMGNGIAHVTALAGYRVMMMDISQDSLTEALYSNSNRIKLTASIHIAWDARLLVINADGSITTLMGDAQLKAIGLTRSARLPQQFLTPERVKFLKHRINDRGAFHLASEMAKHRKRMRTNTNRSVGGVGAGEDV